MLLLINTFSLVSHNRLLSAGMPVVFDKAALPMLLHPYRLHMGPILTFHSFMLRAANAFSILGVDNHTLWDFLKTRLQSERIYYYISDCLIIGA